MEQTVGQFDYLSGARLSWKDLNYDNFISKLTPSQQKNFSEMSSDEIASMLLGGSVNGSALNNLSWNKGRGGSLILGGNGNVNGLLSLLNALGVEKIRLDNDGMLINDGKITIKNSSNESVLSATGLVGSTVYKYGNINGSPSTLFTDTSWTDQASSSLDFSTVQDNVRIMVFLSVQSASGQVNAALDMSGRTEYRPILDSTPLSTTILYDSALTLAVKTTGENVIRKSYSVSGIINIPTAGDHTLKIQRQLSNVSNMSATLYSFDLTYLLLGS